MREPTLDDLLIEQHSLQVKITLSADAPQSGRDQRQALFRQLAQVQNAIARHRSVS